MTLKLIEYGECRGERKVVAVENFCGGDQGDGGITTSQSVK